MAERSARSESLGGLRWWGGVVALVFGCSSPPATTEDGGLRDGAPEAAAADAASVDLNSADVPAGSDAPSPDAPLPPVRCGAGELEPEALQGAPAMVIDHEGTVYLGLSLAPPTSGEYVGRKRPGQPLEQTWVRLGPTSEPVSQMVLQGTFLYLSRGHAIDRLDLRTDPPTLTMEYRSPTLVDGLALAPDGALWFSAAEETASLAWSSGLWRLHEGRATRAEFPRIPWVVTMAFDPRGRLVVALAEQPQVLRLTFDGMREVSRETVLDGRGRVTGIAFDDRDRVYLAARDTQSELLRVGPAGVERLWSRPRPSALGQLDFGAGALRCGDLYASDVYAPGMRLATDARGSDVRWHHPP